jgi:hypothetical protein
MDIRIPPSLRDGGILDYLLLTTTLVEGVCLNVVLYFAKIGRSKCDNTGLGVYCSPVALRVGDGVTLQTVGLERSLVTVCHFSSVLEAE